jgi:hypothetical protein
MTPIKYISKLIMLFVFILTSCNEKEINVVISNEKAIVSNIEHKPIIKIAYNRFYSILYLHFLSVFKEFS